MRTSYGAVTLFFASTQTDRTHAREKRKRCEEQRSGECLRGRRGSFSSGAGRSAFARGMPVFTGRRESMKMPGRRGERRKGIGHDPQVRGACGEGSAPAEEAVLVGQQAPRHSPAFGVLPRRSVCTGLSPLVVLSGAPNAPGDSLQRGRGDVHATLQSAGVLHEGGARRLPEDGRRMCICGASGPGRRTPAEA